MTHASPSISLIVAMSRNRIIGRENALPWHLPADLAFFKKTTLGYPVIMGRKTYQSIGRLLPGRRNLILSRDRNWSIDGAENYSSFEEAMSHCVAEKKVFVIGGAEIFRETLPLAHELFITLVETEIEGDTLFPKVPTQDWRLISQEHQLADEKNQYPITFLHYRRR